MKLLSKLLSQIQAFRMTLTSLNWPKGYIELTQGSSYFCDCIMLWKYNYRVISTAHIKNVFLFCFHTQVNGLHRFVAVELKLLQSAPKDKNFLAI